MPSRTQLILLVPAAAAALAAVALAPAQAAAAASQSWTPFVLVAGLLLVGLAADADGLFAVAGARLARLPGPPLTFYLVGLGLVAVVTAVLNLDTAVVFVTPVLLAAAAARGMRAGAFLYGALVMCNAASLVLPGSNLTNLLVLSGGVSGLHYALRMAPASLAAIAVTAALLVALFRRRLRAGGAPPAPPEAHLRAGPGLVATAGAAVLVLVGLDVGPNLAVTAALSGLLWLRVTRAAGSRPSALRFSLIGAATALPAMAAALLGLALSAGPRP